MRYDWGHTSSLMALTANCHRDPKTAPLTPQHFNPFLPTPKPPKVSIRILKDVFIDGTY